MPVMRTAVTTEVLDAAAHEALVANPRAGATVCFAGVIRNHDPEALGEVTGIEYSHHPDAAALLAALVARIMAQRDLGQESRVAVSHRVGYLRVGEAALVCAVAAPHRAEAFALCGEIVEVIKAELPIWKRQLEADRAVWSGLGRRGQPGVPRERE